MPETATKEIQWEARKNFLINKVMQEHQCGVFDVTGSLVKPPRWALVTRSHRGNGIHIDLVESREEAEQKSGKNLHENFWPVCLYDLDTLIGEEPPMQDGDRVRYGDEEYYVVFQDRFIAEGEPYWKLWLAKDPDADPYGDDCDHTEVDEAEVILLERGEQFVDSREPQCFEVAKVQVVVAFNTVAS